MTRRRHRVRPRPLSSIASLDTIVEELVSRFEADDDVPAEHECPVPLGYGRSLGYDPPLCSHESWSSRSLLDRLVALTVPGTTRRSDGGQKQNRAKAGSPAPWDPSAAELVDEVLRGAVELTSTARRVLEFSTLQVRYRVERPLPEGWHPPMTLPRRDTIDVPVEEAPIADAGRRALRDLLVTMPLLQERFEAHWLVRGERVSNRHPERGYRPGLIEARLRSWHRRAQLVTGHVQPPVILRQMANPVEARPDGRRAIAGPICWRCWHPSCARISYSHMGAWVTVRCPHCGTPGLPQDPVTAMLYCPRPSCTDDDGGRREWAPSALKHLGLDPIEPAPSRLKYSTSTSALTDT